MSQDPRREHPAVNPPNAIEHVPPIQQPDTEAGADALQLIVGLTVGQAAAFEALTSGASIASAARAANVTRKTMYAWLDGGHAFAQAYEQWKNSIAETSRTRLLMIGEAATVQIAKAVRQGDTRAALAVAKGMGLLAAPAVGPSLAQLTAKKRAAEAAQADAIRKDAISDTPFRDLVNIDDFNLLEPAHAQREPAAAVEPNTPATAADAPNPGAEDDA